MKRTARAATAATFLTLALLNGCSFSKSDHPSACQKTSDCARGRSCKLGFCVLVDGGAASTGNAGRGGVTDGGNANTKPDGGKPGMDAGGDAAVGKDGGGQTGADCVNGQPPEDCYDGPAGTADVGICKPGQRACVGGIYTQCLGQVLPADESCNGKDDNCNGKTDEIEQMGDCDTQMPGVCSQGQLVCRGTFAVCELTNHPVEEACNGKDDDCDSKTDEVASIACYPAATVGCTIAADGTAVCVGLCRTGMSQCTAGQTGCTGAVTPVAEACTTGSNTAADENCDGRIDEGCSCTNGDSRPCYAGPVGTAGHGTCREGTQRCSNAVWDDCTGQVLPQSETCQNMGADDDCNDTADDVAGLGDPCIDDAKQGICRDGTTQCASGNAAPTCVTMQAMHELCDPIDQDCDGDPYDGYDLNSDPNNCGTCGNRCDSSEVCCAGSCTPVTDLGMDPKNCGKCGNACGAGQYCCQGDCLNDPSGGGGGIILPPRGACDCKQDCGKEACCGTACVDLLNDGQNCGACGVTCTIGSCCNGHCSKFCVVQL